MEEQKHRVVIQLINSGTDEDYESIPSVLRSAAVLDRPDNPKPEVEQIDCHTLNMNLGSPNDVRMHFDCVANAADQHIRAEVASIMETVIGRRVNCCLVRFNVIRECQSKFIANRLLREMESQLSNVRAKLVEIKLEYFDVRKYEVVNMKGGQRQTRFIFGNSVDLIRWFQVRYPAIWHAGIGHEFFEFQLTLVDNGQRPHVVKFSLLVNYLNKLDCDTKYSLLRFWESLRNVRRMKHSMMTDCLKEYYSGVGNWYTWHLFNIPVIEGAGMVIEDMLMLAKAAQSGIHKLYGKEEVCSSCVVQKITRLGGGNCAMNANNEAATNKDQSIFRESTPLFYTTKSKSNLCGMGNNCGAVDKYRTKDNSISFLYAKINETFTNAAAAMEKYFYHLCDTRIAQLCTEFSLMMNTVDKAHIPKETRLPHVNSVPDKNFIHYQKTMEQCRILTDDIQKSNGCEQLLRVHLRSKSLALQHNVLRFKLLLLEKCKSSLNMIIRREISTLSNLKFSSLKYLNETII